MNEDRLNEMHQQDKLDAAYAATCAELDIQKAIKEALANGEYCPNCGSESIRSVPNYHHCDECGEEWSGEGGKWGVQYDQQQLVDNGLVCPECHGCQIVKLHADYDANPSGLEVYFDECQDCGHQWNHS